MRGDTELFDQGDREGTRIWQAKEGEALCLDGEGETGILFWKKEPWSWKGEQTNREAAQGQSKYL
jgi:hypothetical protein